MRILLDECCPEPLVRAFPSLHIITVAEKGLKGVRNGDLIAAAEGEFDILVTADKNLRYQQNLEGRKLAIVELPFNSWPRLRPILPRLRESLESIKPGEYICLEEILDQ